MSMRFIFQYKFCLFIIYLSVYFYCFRTQSMDNMSNLPNDYFPNLIIKQEVEDEDDGYVNNYNVYDNVEI